MRQPWFWTITKDCNWEQWPSRHEQTSWRSRIIRNIFKQTTLINLTVSALFCSWNRNWMWSVKEARFLPSSDFWATVNHVHWCRGATGCPGILRANDLSSQVCPGEGVTLLFSWDTANLTLEGCISKDSWAYGIVFPDCLEHPCALSSAIFVISFIHPVGPRTSVSGLDKEWLSLLCTNVQSRTRPRMACTGLSGEPKTPGHSFPLWNFKSPD